MVSSRCAFVLIAVILINTATVGAADLTRVFKCPCTFSVVRDVTSLDDRSLQNDTFDILVASFSARSNVRDQRGSVIEKHSLRNIRVSDIAGSDSIPANLRKQYIGDKGLFSVRLRHHTTSAEKASPSLKLLLHESSRKVICPVVFEPDRPRERFVTNLATQETPMSDLKATSRQHRIEGGLLAAPTLLPYLVSIAIPCPGGEPNCFVSCSGTLLAPKWIMTAAHCNIPTGSAVYVSTSMRHRGYSVEVKTWIPHPLYSTIYNLGKKEQYDIAVMELRENVHNCCIPGPRYMPISFNKSAAKPGSFVRVAGYGFVSDKHDATDDPTDGSLRSVDLPVVENRVCREQYFGYSLNLISRKRQICAGYFEDGGCDTCFGDSGGPLVQYHGVQPVLVGITSFGVGCGKPSFPGIYSRLAGHEEWLRSTGAVFKEHQGDLEQVTANCAPGEFLPYDPGKLSVCTPCPFNHFSAGGPLRTCKRCPATKWRDPEDGSRCSCSARKGYGGSNGMCVECPPGTFGPVGMKRCIKCPAGSFSDTFARGKCEQCPGAPKGATVCNTVRV